jgi:A/G-specific adenine glycosylase
VERVGERRAFRGGRLSDALVDPRDVPRRSSADLDRWMAEALSKWFAGAARDLPWRKTRDPYAIWVSEVMLQQTRVDTVIDYHPRFIARFPDLATLADADEDEVLSAWSGLGYYRRARLLHAGARWLATHEGGRVPVETEDLLRVPGIGKYTAGAIRSIAHDRPAAIVDGNIARVLSRVHAIEEVEQQGANAQCHWERSRTIVAAGSPRIVAQALMELGATVCTPRAPACGECPLRRRCRARARGLTGTIPAVKRRGPTPVDELWAVWLRFGEAVLVERRANAGLLANMWCLPIVDRSVRDPVADVAARLEIEARPEGSVADTEELRHVFTHRTWSLRLCNGKLTKRPPLRSRTDLQLVGADAALEGGIPTLTRKLLSLGFAGDRPRAQPVGVRSLRRS